MLNGVACGMIYRPLKAITPKPDVGAPACDGLRQLAVVRTALEEKQQIRAASISSLSPDRTRRTKDMCFVGVKVSNSISQSWHAVNDVSTSLTKVRFASYSALKNFSFAETSLNYLRPELFQLNLSFNV